MASPSFTLKVQPGSNGDASVSLTQTHRWTKIISTFDNWLEAWNIFIRSMVHSHPHLPPELLTYQESFCSLSRSYAFQACYRYDIAFLNIARNHLLSWARLDEYAFSKLLRCASPVPATSQYHCYRCRSTSHFNNNQSCKDQNCPWQHICNHCKCQRPRSSCPTLKR